MYICSFLDDIFLFLYLGFGVVCFCYFDFCGIEIGCKKMLGLVKELLKDKLLGRLVGINGMV